VWIYKNIIGDSQNIIKDTQILNSIRQILYSRQLGETLMSTSRDKINVKDGKLFLRVNLEEEFSEEFLQIIDWMEEKLLGKGNVTITSAAKFVIHQMFLAKEKGILPIEET